MLTVHLSICSKSIRPNPSRIIRSSGATFARTIPCCAASFASRWRVWLIVNGTRSLGCEMRLRYSGEPVQIRIAQREKEAMANDNQKKEPFEEAILEPDLLNEIAPRNSYGATSYQGAFAQCRAVHFRVRHARWLPFFRGRGRRLANALSSMRWPWLVLAVLMVVGYWFSNRCACRFSRVTCFRNSVSAIRFVQIIGQYFNCITPLSSGGQPFQAYYY